MTGPRSQDVAELYLTVARAAEAAIADPAVSQAWEQDSALDGYTVGGLAGHLARAILTVERYLDVAVPDVAATDAAGYFAHVLGDHHPVTSDLHQAVRQRSAAASQDGPTVLLQRLADARASLERRLATTPPDQPIAVLGDLVLPLSAYLQTRLVELVVHLDDLAVSVDRSEPSGIPPAAYDVVAAVLAQVAVRRVGPLPTIRSLARAERHPDAVRAL